jgi:hypothetical protein
LFVFGVCEEEIDFIFKQVVNDPDSSPLAPFLCRPSNLPKSAASANDISCLWVEGKDHLETSVGRVIKQIRDLLGENWSLDELHMTYYTSLAHGAKLYFRPSSAFTHIHERLARDVRMPVTDAAGWVLSASLRCALCFSRFGMSRSLQIFRASMSLTSACLGTDERLFLVWLPHHE